MAEAISKARSEAKISTKNVVTSLPESEVFTRMLVMPKMSPSELESAISWEAEQYIPLPLSEVNYSYSVVEVKADGGMEVMVVAAPKRLVEKYERVFKLASLTPVAIETELLSASRSLVGDNVADLTLVVDSGARTTDMSIIKSSNMVFTRTIATAGEALTRALMANLQLDEGQAEAFKRSYGLRADQLEGKVATALDSVIQVMLTEIRRTINFYESRGTQEKVRRVVLSGGTSLLPELVTKFATVLNIEVEIGNCLLKVVADERVGQIPTEQLPLYGVVMGLAMKSV
jgi:type IV pilus assembly protein PilM